VDYLPGVPEIQSTTAVLFDLFQHLPPTDFDRAIVFPMCLAGSLTDDPMMRDYIKRRCAAHNDEYVGTMYQARTFMESVWNRRAAASNMTHRGVALAVDWRECLKDRWSNLFLA